MVGPIGTNYHNIGKLISPGAQMCCYFRENIRASCFCCNYIGNICIQEHVCNIEKC